jgi:uncharacterized membrane protein YhhN
MKTKVFTGAYLIIGILYMCHTSLIPVLPGFILKILIIPALMLILALNLLPGKKLLPWIMFAGLFFSWIGDVLLEIPESHGDFFIPGLVSFLLAQVMYLTTFFSTPGKSIIFKKPYLLIPVLIYGAGLVYYLYNDLDGMRIPVILYAIVILAMLSGSIDRFEKVNGQSYRLVLAGAALFVISDSLLAVNKFSYHIEHDRIWVMVTYISAQYLIIMGYIRQFREKVL